MIYIVKFIDEDTNRERSIRFHENTLNHAKKFVKSELDPIGKILSLEKEK